MIEQRIRARVGAYSVPAVVHAVQGDTGRVFVFELEDYTVTGNEGASLNCMRPDGSFYTYAGTVSAEDNTVTVALDVEGGALTQEGVCTFQLELVEAGLIVCTFRGSIIVEPVVGGEATQEEKDFRDAIQAQLNDKASNAQLTQVESDLTDSIDAVADDLAQEILDRTAADATKANKSTTINGKDLSENRVIYAQDIPSKNLLPNNASTQTINGVTFTVNSDGSISTSGTASADISYTLITLTQAEASQYSGCILSGCPSGGADSSYYFKMQRNGSPWTGYGTDYGNGVTLSTIDANAYIIIGVKSGTNMNGKTFRPMIRLASIEDDSYVPYAKTNVELSQGSAGSNYTRLPDGTQICWGRFRVPGGSASAWAGVYHIEYTLNEAFPVPFISNPSVTATCDNESSGVVDHLLWTSEKITGIGVVRQTATDYQKYFSYIAVGRWK